MVNSNVKYGITNRRPKYALGLNKWAELDVADNTLIVVYK